MTRSHDRGSMAAAETAAEIDQPRFWNVPNSMTVARLGLAAVVFAFMGLDQYAIALAAFILAALSDALDGYLRGCSSRTRRLAASLTPWLTRSSSRAATSTWRRFLKRRVFIPGWSRPSWSASC